MTPQAKKLAPHLKVQVVARMNNLKRGSQSTPETIAARYKIKPADAYELQEKFNNGNWEFKKKKGHWNPAWDEPDVIHHPVDSEVMIDMLNGCAKDESGLIGMFDADFDSINGVYHTRWSDSDIQAVIYGLPERLADILENASEKSEIYKEAMAFLETPLFRLICKYYGWDTKIHYGLGV